MNRCSGRCRSPGLVGRDSVELGACSGASSLWRRTKQKLVMKAHKVEARSLGKRETRQRRDEKDDPRGG